MENFVNLDLMMRRMHCRATGVWETPDAIGFRARMIRVCDRMAATGDAFSVLADLTGLAVHAQEISPIIAEGAGQLQRVRLSRYAMIVPMALMRMQVRRLHPGVNMRFFDARADAVAWLGWHERPIAILRPPAPFRPARSFIPAGSASPPLR